MTYLLDHSVDLAMYLLNSPVLGALVAFLVFAVACAIVNDFTGSKFE